MDNDCFYTPQEKKKINPNKTCYKMYAMNNTDANKVEEILIGDYGRILESVPITAYSFCDAVLFQISHDRNKYKSLQLLQQMAFYMAKYPDKMIDVVKPFLGKNSYELYIKNMFHGTKYLDIEVCAAVLSFMCNMKITIIYPSKGSVPFYHRDCTPDVVLVFNEMVQPESHFTATKPDNDKWHPSKGKDWSNEIKILQNVKHAHTLAKKKLHERLVKKVINDYNDVTSQLNTMKETLNLYVDQMKSMETKIKTWSINVGKMEGKQGVLRMKLLELGVSADALKKTGPPVEGIHFTAQIPAVPTVTRVPTLPTSTITQADIHATPTSTTVQTTVETTGSMQPSVVAQAQSSDTMTTTSTVGQLIPLSAAQISQILTPGPSAVGGPQQILNVGGQNVLILGSGPATIGGISVRYGKMLKGTHKYFCNHCKRPFTQKESLTRHEQENCPMVEKKKYICDQCQSTFSSKQYLTEHINEIHLQIFTCHCKGCGKGFYKHCGLVHHKKSCLSILAPGVATNPVVNPTVNTAATTDTTARQQ